MRSRVRPSVFVAPAALATLLLAVRPAGAGTVTFRVTPPPSTPPDATLYLAGDFQGWRPGEQAWALTRQPDGSWQLARPFSEGAPLQFKFTLGGWGRVEKGPAGEELQNRLHVVVGDQTLEITVAGWADGAPPGDTVTGDVRPLAAPGFLDGRRVWVWLPPGYDQDAARRYPVLYMLDGQNVFNAATSFAGEWRVDESLADLVAHGDVEPLIVVAVANGEGRRALEYTPWPEPSWQEATGGGAEHLARIIEDLMPVVDSVYRTRKGPKNTGLAGSSFGGLMALHAAWSRPDVFGRLAALSPSLGWSGSAALAAADSPARPDVRLYVDMGSRESGNLQDDDGNGVDDAIDDLRSLRAILLRRGFTEGGDLLVVEDEGARHHESYWARRFPAAARFLFPAH